MSPEQARGDRTVDWRSDLWALAVIAYECLVGSRPFEAEGVGTLLVKICTDPIPVPSSVAMVPAGFDAWFERATRREPDERFQSAREMMDALRAILLGAQAGPDSGAAASLSGGRIEGANLASAAVLARPDSRATTEMTASSLVGPPSTKRRRSGALAAFGVVVASALGAAVFFARGNDAGEEASVAPPSALGALPQVSAAPAPPIPSAPVVVPVVDAEKASVDPSPQSSAAALQAPPVAASKRAAARPQVARKTAPAAPPKAAPSPNRVRDIGF